MIARFLSNDPVGFADGGTQFFNRYAYTNNNPVNAIDPTGLACEPTGESTGIVCQNDGEAFGSIEEAVASVAENLINFTNETGFEAFAVIQETADGFVVTDAVSTGGTDNVDTPEAISILGISNSDFKFRIGDLHTHPGTDFESRLFSESDVRGNEESFDARDFLIDNSGISSISKRFPGRPTNLTNGETGFRGRSVAKRNQSGGFTLNNPPRRRRR